MVGNLLVTLHLSKNVLQLFPKINNIVNFVGMAVLYTAAPDVPDLITCNVYPLISLEI